MEFTDGASTTQMPFISDLGDPRLVVIRPLPVELASWDATTTAYLRELGEFGVGADEDEALDDLRASIVELYFTLKENRDRLGPIAQSQWRYLAQVVREA